MTRNASVVYVCMSRPRDSTAAVGAKSKCGGSTLWLHPLTPKQDKRTYDFSGTQYRSHKTVPQHLNWPIMTTTRYELALYTHAKAPQKSSHLSTVQKPAPHSQTPKPSSTAPGRRIVALQGTLSHVTSPLPSAVRSLACWRYCSQRACSTRAAPHCRQCKGPAPRVVPCQSLFGRQSFGRASNSRYVVFSMLS